MIEVKSRLWRERRQTSETCKKSMTQKCCCRDRNYHDRDIAGCNRHALWILLRFFARTRWWEMSSVPCHHTYQGRRSKRTSKLTFEDPWCAIMFLLNAIIRDFSFIYVKAKKKKNEILSQSSTHWPTKFIGTQVWHQTETSKIEVGQASTPSRLAFL